MKKTHTRHIRGLYAPELLEERIAPATFIVTKIVDDGTAGTLRDAIGKANTHPGADTITFAASGQGHIVLNGTKLTISDSLTIKGPGVDFLNVDGNDMSQVFAIFGAGPPITAAISGLTVSHGEATGGSGGGIVSTETTTLTNVVVANCTAALGGGIFINTDGKATLSGVHLLDNTATGSGGGVYGRARGGFTLTGSLVAGNSAPFGGGVDVAMDPNDKADSMITKSVIANNTFTIGGGGVAVPFSSNHKVLVKNSLITGNNTTTAGARGGGIDSGSIDLVLDHVIFSGNKTTMRGGGLSASGKTVKMTACSLVGNTTTDAAGDGGGAIFLNGGVQALVSGTTVAGNTSASKGGGILADFGAQLTLKGGSVTGNTATTDGGGLAIHHGTIKMTGAVISGNNAGATGGGLSGDAGAEVHLTGGSFLGNSAVTSGGGVSTFGTGGDAVALTVTGTLFESNRTTGGATAGGGAIKAGGEGEVILKAIKVLGNTVTGDGGGLYLNSTVPVILTGSLISGNTGTGASSDGGGVYLHSGGIFTGNTITDNRVIARGGGIFIKNGTLTLAMSKVIGNIAATGGGVYNLSASAFELKGSKVTGDFAPTDPDIHGLFAIV